MVRGAGRDPGIRRGDETGPRRGDGAQTRAPGDVRGRAETGQEALDTPARKRLGQQTRPAGQDGAGQGGGAETDQVFSTERKALTDALAALDLPPRVRDLCDAIGPAALLRLAREYGGGRVYVPARIEREHPLAKALGDLDAARKLAAYCNGETLAVPKLDCLERALRDAAIRAAWPHSSVRDLAWRFGLTERQIYRIINDDSNDDQLKLF